MHNALWGALAGTAATAPMTLVMELLRRRLPFWERYPLPPRQITVEAAHQAGISSMLDERDVKALTTAAHFGYGGAMGVRCDDAQRATRPAEPCLRLPVQ